MYADFDEVVPKLSDAQRIFLKIDTQGFERRVLEGAEAILDRIAMVQLELAWKPSYQGQTVLTEMMSLMDQKGFQPVQVDPAWVDRGQVIREIDVVFARARNHDDPKGHLG